MFKILVVDDDQAIRWNLKNTLKNDYAVFDAACAEEAISVFQKEKFDLCLLDVNLPGDDGFTLCQKIRRTSLVPIVFITVKDDEASLARGLLCGGDDYVTKPFSYRELGLRVMAQLRRSNYKDLSENVIVREDYVLDLDQKTLKKAGKQIEITKTEFELLQYLMRRSGCLVTREMLLCQVWDIHENFVENNTLSVNISRLRKKLTTADAGCPIETVPGIGYRWKERY